MNRNHLFATAAITALLAGTLPAQAQMLGGGIRGGVSGMQAATFGGGFATMHSAGTRQTDISASPARAREWMGPAASFKPRRLGRRGRLALPTPLRPIPPSQAARPWALASSKRPRRATPLLARLAPRPVRRAASARPPQDRARRRFGTLMQLAWLQADLRPPKSRARERMRATLSPGPLSRLRRRSLIARALRGIHLPHARVPRLQ